MRDKTKRHKSYLKAINREIYFSTEELNELRGKFMIRFKRDITWKEFAELLNVNPRALGLIRAGRRAYPGVLARIIAGAREHGVMIQASDYIRQ